MNAFTKSGNNSNILSTTESALHKLVPSCDSPSEPVSGAAELDRTVPVVAVFTIVSAISSERHRSVPSCVRPRGRKSGELKLVLIKYLNYL